MGPETVAHSTELEAARVARGESAWRYHIDHSGIWPEVGPDDASESFYNALGEYARADVVRVVEDADLTGVPIDRAWPWIARAVWNYQSTRRVNAFVGSSQQNIDRLVADIAMEIKKLRPLLDDLKALTFMSGSEIGEAPLAKALAVAIDGEAGELSRRLLKLRRACNSHSGKVSSSRTRRPQDPHLAGLVADLSEFWRRAFGESAPINASPSGWSGREPPFVRLVNACLDLAGRPLVSAKIVATAISSVPKGV